MSMDPRGKYRPFALGPQLMDRQWPGRTIARAPKWCSVDLRDGNQSLASPMTVEQKLEMFGSLVKIGFKQIEVGFPAASETDSKVVCRLIEGNLIPKDVTIQVLVPTREDLIKDTVKSLVGACRVIIHLYISTSPAQRRVVLKKTKAEIVSMAVQGVKWVQQYSEELRKSGTEVILQFSPESFSATEVQFALEVCEAAMNVWGPTPQHPMIINLPSTVETATANVFADQIEWLCGHLTRRNCAVVSLHVHNDRGTGVAATEFGLMAGADRIEGTLFGNGERTGNADLVTLALNMYTQGIDPELDFSDLPAIIDMYERCTGMEVSLRHPYAGGLVHTAFSGTHQDAIKKGMEERAKIGGDVVWDVPYLHIDPPDIGLKYQVIRVNGQSGKGGIAYLLETECGVCLPKEMQREFGPIAGDKIDALGREVTAEELKTMFWEEYVERTSPYAFVCFSSAPDAEGHCTCAAVIRHGNREFDVRGTGVGPIAAFVDALKADDIADVNVIGLHGDALAAGKDALEIVFIGLQFHDGSIRWGAGVDANSEWAPIRAIISALNRRQK